MGVISWKLMNPQNYLNKVEKTLLRAIVPLVNELPLMGRVRLRLDFFATY